MKKKTLILILGLFHISFSQNFEITYDVPDNIKGNKVIKNYLKKIGGIHNLNKINTLEKNATVHIKDVPEHLFMNATVIYKEPNLYFSSLEMNNVGKIQSTKYNGKVCIVSRKNNTEIITTEIKGDLLLEKLNEFEPFPILHELNNKSIFKITEIHTMPDSILYKVEINNNNKVSFYFDHKSNLLVKKETIMFGSEIRTKTIEYSDYRKVKNILIPFSINEVIKESDEIIQNTSTNIEEVLINHKVELLNFQ